MPLKKSVLLSKFSRTEIETLFAKIIHRFKKAGLTVLLAPRSLSYGRLLLSVSRKAGNAPQRNRLKRQLRALFGQFKLADTAFDWAFIVKDGHVRKLSFKELESMIKAIQNEIDQNNKPINS